MQNGDENRMKIRSDKSIIFSKKKLYGAYFEVLFVALDQTHHLRPFAASGQKIFS
jgi:hypothetical protein